MIVKGGVRLIGLHVHYFVHVSGAVTYRQQTPLLKMLLVVALPFLTPTLHKWTAKWVG